MAELRTFMTMWLTAYSGSQPVIQRAVRVLKQSIEHEGCVGDSAGVVLIAQIYRLPLIVLCHLRGSLDALILCPSEGKNHLCNTAQLKITH